MTIPNKIILAVGAWAILLTAVLWDEARAGGNNNDIIYNTTTYNETNLTETTITSGASETDLAAGLSMAMAISGHQFDYSYSDWQWSATMGAQLSDEQENAFSVGIANRFSKLDKALFHGAYSQSNGDHYILLGVTGRF